MTSMMPFCNNSFVYHRPKTRIETNEVVIEYCENCKEEVIFRKGQGGKINNSVYRVFHERDGLQSNHPRFNYEYPQTSKV